MTRSLILCDCCGTQSLDVDQLSRVEGVRCSRVHSALCMSEQGRAADLIAEAAAAGEAALIACAQEAALFAEIAAEQGAPEPHCLDLRDRAGWSDSAAAAGPKMAALLAEALLPPAATPMIDVESAGQCLIAGPGAAALPLARLLAPTLAVTVLLSDPEPDPPAEREFDIAAGRLVRVSGALGGFDLRIDGFRDLVPGGRGEMALSAPRDGARSRCDIVIDLTGGPALVPAPDKREGYLRADPRDPLAVTRLAVTAVQLQGTFEKPLYLRLEEALCAHARAGQTGCSRCLDLCPTGAISPAGDHVAIDPMVCAGCGGCAAACPSGAISYQAPEFRHLVMRLRRLAEAYRDAGGAAPRLLVHDGHGAEMIRLGARFGRGLPADLIPLELPVISGFGHAEMLAALALGFADLTVLIGPGAETDALRREAALARALAGAPDRAPDEGADGGADAPARPARIALIEPTDPEALCAALHEAPPPPTPVRPVLPLGNRRQAARMAAQALNPADAPPLPLPEGAPYGAVLVDGAACTLCLSCVSLCPSGALLDNPDRPQLRFQEDACLQCGICATICPEKAITLEPRMDLSDGALRQRVLNEEEPFECVECGKPFGVKSTVERIMDKLAGQHAMFATSAAARMIAMCDDCRIQAQAHQQDSPFAAAPRPRPRSTEDYLSKRRDH